MFTAGSAPRIGDEKPVRLRVGPTAQGRRCPPCAVAQVAPHWAGWVDLPTPHNKFLALPDRANVGGSDIAAAIRSVLSRYAKFTGRAERPEFWWWMLFLIVLFTVARTVDYAVIMPLLGASDEQRSNGQPLSFLVALATLSPTLAVGARRLHDTARSAWWLLIGLIPVVGTLVLLYFFVQPSANDTA